MAIYSPKVTIHFGPVRVVVSTHPSMRVGDLASIAHLRYCKAVRKHPSTVRLRRLVAFRGRVILDPFDFVDDLFDHGFGDQALSLQFPPVQLCNSSQFQILAIFDEPTPHQLTPTSCSSASSPSSSGHVVEVTNLSAPPPVGLKVDSTPKPISIATNMSSASSSSSSSQRRYVRNQNGRKSTDSGIPTRSVTLSPEIEKREVKPESESMIKRTDARKSRISEALFDKLEEMAISSPSPSSTKPKSNLSGLIKSTADPSHTIVVLNKFGASKEIGIEISGVPHPSYTDRLEAVEVLRIDPEGRVAEDGRFRVGDHLVELNERPVYQMSLARVRAYLHELASCVAPTVTVNRPIESFAAPERHENAASELKPVASALQQANTKQLGNTLAVSIVKGADGLGFTIRSRETTGNDGSLERLFYVATVKSDGAAQGTLRRGDRLLEVDGRPIAGLNQREVVERMKMVPIGSPVTLLISRLISTAEESAAPSGSVTPSAPRKPPQAPAAREDSPRLEGQILDFEIPVNDTGSAGLGISLKARTKIKPDNSRKDSGIFVKHIITGGAAYKDGRLMISDQIIGIEDVDLTRFEKNAQANEAITQCLRRLGPNVKAVRLKVRRVSSQEEPSNSSTIGVVDTTVASTTVTTPLQSPQKASRQNSAIDDAASEVSSVHGDHFSRDNVTRRSVSEKRHLGAANDPSHLQIFQKIKHQRQTSGSMRRRSASAESISLKRSERSEEVPGVHELVGNGSTQFVKHREPSKEPPGTMARKMAKEKQQRRKSIGSTIFSRKWFSLGGKSRDASPEKPARHEEEYKRMEAASPASKRNTVNIDHHRLPSSDYYRNQKKLECATSPGRRVVANSVFYSERNTREEGIRPPRHRSQIFPRHPFETVTDTPLGYRITTEAQARRPTSIFTTERHTTPVRSPPTPRQCSSVLVDSCSQEVRLRPLRTSTPLPESPLQWPPPARTTTTPSTPGSRTADESPGLRLVTSVTGPALRASSSRPNPLLLHSPQDNTATATERRHSRLPEEPSTIQYRRALQQDQRRPVTLLTPTEPPQSLPPGNPGTSCATALQFTSIVSNANPRMSLRARKQRAAVRVFDVDKNEMPPILLRAKSDARPISPSDIHVHTDLDKPQVPLRREAFRFSNRRESESRSRSTVERGDQRPRRRPNSEVLVFNENESPPAYC